MPKQKYTGRLAAMKNAPIPDAPIPDGPQSPDLIKKWTLYDLHFRVKVADRRLGEVQQAKALRWRLSDDADDARYEAERKVAALEKVASRLHIGIEIKREVPALEVDDAALDITHTPGEHLVVLVSDFENRDEQAEGYWVVAFGMTTSVYGDVPLALPITPIFTVILAGTGVEVGSIR